ncbi:uncharacterized protein LOC128556584 isoform X2 [Mercenaria mercenaria]|uniref:uncharacterized protein LOC128556584 isoform X2 n=1 Tax=Mercenaria mercenaria TaxID=6596 RepID=UPI00234FB016|nr:uncharacterized protein LOC128556584 isoform X2 [Mercenaria mercenaria]
MDVRCLLIFVLVVNFCQVDGCERRRYYYCGQNSRCRFNKRSIDNQQRKQNVNGDGNRTYSITIRECDPCNFNTYDGDRDGKITMEELQAILCIKRETSALFADIDVIPEDGVINTNEFFSMVPLVVPECSVVTRNNASCTFPEKDDI